MEAQNYDRGGQSRGSQAPADGRGLGHYRLKPFGHRPDNDRACEAKLELVRK